MTVLLYGDVLTSNNVDLTSTGFFLNRSRLDYGRFGRGIGENRQSIAHYVTNVSITNGRANPTAGFSEPSCTVTMRNDNDQFADERAADDVVRWQRGDNIDIQLAGVYVYRGVVHAAKASYPAKGGSTVTLTCKSELASHFSRLRYKGSAPVETASDRIRRILWRYDDGPIPPELGGVGTLGLQEERVIDLDLATRLCAAQDYDGPVLSAISSVELHALGRLAYTKEDELKWIPFGTPGGYTDEEWDALPHVRITSNVASGHILASSIERTTSGGDFPNRIEATMIDGTVVKAPNSLTEGSLSTKAGLDAGRVKQQTWSLGTIPAVNETQALQTCNAQLGWLGLPDDRATGCTVAVHGLSEVQRAELAALDIGERVFVGIEHNIGARGGNTRTRGVVQSVSHSWSTSGGWVTKLEVCPMPQRLTSTGLPASGGKVAIDGDWVYHTFINTAEAETLVVNEVITGGELLVVAGGDGGEAQGQSG